MVSYCIIKNSGGSYRRESYSSHGSGSYSGSSSWGGAAASKLQNMTTTILTFAITLLSVTGAWAYDFKVGDLCYNITDKDPKNVEVTFEQESLENNYSYLSVL